MYCIVLYYEALYWWPIRPLSYRHSSGVVRNPHSTLAEWGIFNLALMFWYYFWMKVLTVLVSRCIHENLLCAVHGTIICGLCLARDKYYQSSHLFLYAAIIMLIIVHSHCWISHVIAKNCHYSWYHSKYNLITYLQYIFQI